MEEPFHMTAPLPEPATDITDDETQPSPEADAPSDSEQALGDPGKMALAAERRRANAAEKTNKTLQQRITDLENAALSADEKALKEAVDTARAEATAAAEAALRPRLQLSDIRGYAATILNKEQLDGWLSGIDPGKFVGDDGEVDEDKVMTSLTAMYGRPTQQGHSPPPRWGQYGNDQTTSGTPGGSGRAEAQRRYGKT